MGVLRLFHDWAFRTEFKLWLTETAIHACIVFVLLALWFGIGHPNVRTANGIGNCVAAVVVGGFVAWFIPFGFVLVITGQAFITSGVATLVYMAVSAGEQMKRPRRAPPHRNFDWHAGFTNRFEVWQMLPSSWIQLPRCRFCNGTVIEV